MVPELLTGLMWLTRAAVRAGRTPVVVGHGYADANYRPPQLPYVSVVGPMGLRPEPERERTQPVQVLMLKPGHLRGAPRTAGDSVPAGGSLRLRFDGEYTITLAALPGGDFDQAATGPSLSEDIENQLHDGVDSGEWFDEKDEPVSDPVALSVLRRTSCRWDASEGRLHISSGRYGAVDGADPSSVEVLDVPGNIAEAAGLIADVDHAEDEPNRHQIDGRFYRHQIDQPRAMAVDVRVDLWAVSQTQLARLMDRWAQVASAHSSFVTRPALLAADVEEGADRIRLLPSGEPTLPNSLVHLEGGEGWVDRVSDREFAVLGPVTADPDTGLRFAPGGELEAPLYARPLVPDPLMAPHPAPRGLALSLGLQLDAVGSAGQTSRLFSLHHDNATVLDVTLALVSVGSDLVGELTGTASFTGAAGGATASTTRRVPLPRLTQGLALHVTVDGATGAVELFLDGEAQDLDDSTVTPLAPVRVTGIPPGGFDMRLVLGDASAGQLTYHLDHVHLLDEPMRALDPRLRAGLTPAHQLALGDRIVLAETQDGLRPAGRAFVAAVGSANGREVVLDRPLDRAWRRGHTLVYQRELFFQQLQLRRKDDLTNHMYRLSGEYRVSASLDDPRASLTAQLAERVEMDVDVHTTRTRDHHDAPGVAVVDHVTHHRR